jgi:radical SAM-linked protein
VLDLRLEREITIEDLPERLNATLPPGIQVRSVEQVDEGEPALQTQVVSAEYKVALAGSSPGSDLQRRVDSVLQAASIPRERRGKAYDLRPLIETLEVSDDTIAMRLAAREGATGRPEEVLDLLGIAFEDVKIERTRLVFNSPSLKDEIATGARTPPSQ